MYRKESSLTRHAKRYLAEQGYTVQARELPFFDHRIDVCGLSPETGVTYAIELKLSKWQRAFEQALAYQLCADFSSVALPRNAAERVDRDLLNAHGVGLLSVEPEGGCYELLAPTRSNVLRTHYHAEVVEWLKRRGTA